MADLIDIEINGERRLVSASATAAAAVWAASNDAAPSFRRSLVGQARGVLCGMGICFECRAVVDGRPNVRTCQLSVREGMTIRTEGSGG